MIHEEKEGMQIGYLIERLLALFLVFASFPIFFLVWLAIKIDDGQSVFFRQKRWGKNKKPFSLFKFRTMVPGAEEKKKELSHLNETDWPVFKIRNDPRYTRVGKFLAHVGIDELPQLINIVKGEMSFIGPRPLPVEEAKQIPKKYHQRFEVLPGITSLWVVKGAHKLSFAEWMKLDLEYLERRSFTYDLKIALLTVFLIIKEISIKLQKMVLRGNNVRSLV